MGPITNDKLIVVLVMCNVHVETRLMHLTHLIQTIKWVMSIAHDKTCHLFFIGKKTMTCVIFLFFLLGVGAWGSKLEPNLFSFGKQISSHIYGQMSFFISTASGIHQNRQLSPEKQKGKIFLKITQNRIDTWPNMHGNQRSFLYWPRQMHVYRNQQEGSN